MIGNKSSLECICEMCKFHVELNVRLTVQREQGFSLFCDICCLFFVRYSISNSWNHTERRLVVGGGHYVRLSGGNTWWQEAWLVLRHGLVQLRWIG